MIRVLCITDCADRAEAGLFTGLSAVCQLTVLANPAGRYYALMQASGIDVRPLVLSGRFDGRGSAHIRQLLRDGSYDLAHAFNSRALACLLRASRGMPVAVLGYRGISAGVGYLRPECWHTYMHPRLAGILCVSEAVRQSLSQVGWGRWRLPPEKLRTLYKGHDCHWYAETELGRPLPALPPEAEVVVTVSKADSRKGIFTLLDAVDLLSAERHIELLVVGQAASSEAARRRVARCVYPQRVHLLGYRDDVPALMRRSQVLVSASQCAEGLPRVVIEAMCVGTPVIATDAGGSRELVRDGETGLLVPMCHPPALAAALLTTLSNPQAAARRAAAARALIKSQFHVEQTVRALRGWYDELLAGR